MGTFCWACSLGLGAMATAGDRLAVRETPAERTREPTAARADHWQIRPLDRAMKRHLQISQSVDEAADARRSAVT